MRDRLLRDLIEWMGGGPSLLDDAGVTVVGHPDRAESRASAGYTLGRHLFVTCDPAAEPMLEQAVSGVEPTLAAWQKVADELGGEFLGSGRMQVLNGPTPTVADLPAGFSCRRLSRTDADDLALIGRLIERSDPDDLDEAEIELDDLDPIIDVVIDPQGEIATFSSACPFSMALGYGDIGIMTRQEHRGLGLGSVAVSALCARMRSEGLEPLYRCDDENVGSIKLSAGLGFEIATQLVAYRFDVTA